MIAPNPIALVLADFYPRLDGVRESAAYMSAHGLDAEAIYAHVGIMAVLPVIYDGHGHFDFDGKTPSAVVEVYADDAETTVDLCAWPLDVPDRFATALGVAAVLGATNVANPATWAFDGLLPVHRTPLAWLKAGGNGVVILDHFLAPFVLGQALGPILGEDAAHALDLRRMLCRRSVDPANILYPRASLERIAA